MYRTPYVYVRNLNGGASEDRISRCLGAALSTECIQQEDLLGWRRREHDRYIICESVVEALQAVVETIGEDVSSREMARLVLSVNEQYDALPWKDLMGLCGVYRLRFRDSVPFSVVLGSAGQVMR